jgi:ABC-2 type transport system permease protein
MTAPSPQSDVTFLPPQPRQIRGLNRVGLITLVEKEVGRFLSVTQQTIVAPVITTLLFYTVFALAFGGNERMIGDVSFMQFLAPGLIMMAMVQNAFANSSSSLTIAKVQGNVVDLLLPPLSDLEIFLGFVIGALCRGLAVGVAAGIVLSLFAPVTVVSWSLVIIFALLGNMLMGTLGLMAGIWAEKFDHMATVTNFIVTPLTFLSGTFYSVNSLPESWHAIVLYNPFFYMIDGFRAGFTGHVDGNIAVGIAVLVAVNIALSSGTLIMLSTGYKMKS